MCLPAQRLVAAVKMERAGVLLMLLDVRVYYEVLMELKVLSSEAVVVHHKKEVCVLCGVCVCVLCVYCVMCDVCCMMCDM